MKKTYSLILGLCLCTLMATAQHNVWPKPQQTIQLKTTISATSFLLQSKVKLDDANLKFIQSIFPVSQSKAKENAVIKINSFKKGSTLNPEAYQIDIKNKQIVISISSQRSLFYALQTLKQLVTKENQSIILQEQKIIDFPDVQSRGTVEGFYGTPWSFEDRINQLKFYGQLKMNTYIYGPKDDPYHSSPHWRDAYPKDKETEIKALVDEANKNYVDFVWAIHPGKDIKWNKTDSSNLLHKFELMYNLGVRSFAVFFDDISGEGTNPAKQAGLLNYLHQSFVLKKKDVKPLIMCPTEYNKSWSNPASGTYLDILGDQLDPSIQIMWTGNRVISDIEIPTMEWINKRIKRNAYIWWNFPVSDYVRDHLLMGPVYGNGLDIAPQISGFVSNPMERAEASKIAIFGIAGYTWNMKEFNSAKAFDQAIETIVPEASAQMKIFAENNSDLGPNGHGYRRTETVRMQMPIQELSTSLKTQINLPLLEQVKKYFDSIAIAPSIIINKTKNHNLIKEIKPWLQQFALLGKAGSSMLNSFQNFDQENLGQRWDNYLKISHLLDEMKKIDQKDNQNPYQPGVKVGSLVLMPFVNNGFKLLGSKITGQSLEATNNLQLEKIITNIEQIKNQGINANEKQIAISPVFEPITLNPGQYFGLQWVDNRQALQLIFNFDQADIYQWAVFETSKDGINWQKITTQINAKTKQIKLDKDILFIRLINQSNSKQQLYLKQFVLQTTANNNSKNLSLIKDNNLSTSVVVAPEETISTSVNPNKSLVILLDAANQEVEILNDKNQILIKGATNYIELNSKLINKNSTITLKNKGKEAIRIYEIY